MRAIFGLYGRRFFSEPELASSLVLIIGFCRMIFFGAGGRPPSLAKKYITLGGFFGTRRIRRPVILKINKK